MFFSPKSFINYATLCNSLYSVPRGYNQLHLLDKLDLYATIREYNLDKLTKYMFRPDVASGVFILIYLY